MKPRPRGRSAQNLDHSEDPQTTFSFNLALANFSKTKYYRTEESNIWEIIDEFTSGSFDIEATVSTAICKALTSPDQLPFPNGKPEVANDLVSKIIEICHRCRNGLLQAQSKEDADGTCGDPIRVAQLTQSLQLGFYFLCHFLMSTSHWLDSRKVCL